MTVFFFILDLTDDITETGLLKTQSILKAPECSDLVHVFTFCHTNLNERMTSTWEMKMTSNYIRCILWRFSNLTLVSTLPKILHFVLIHFHITVQSKQICIILIASSYKSKIQAWKYLTFKVVFLSSHSYNWTTIMISRSCYCNKCWVFKFSVWYHYILQNTVIVKSMLWGSKVFPKVYVWTNYDFIVTSIRLSIFSFVHPNSCTFDDEIMFLFVRKLIL